MTAARDPIKVLIVDDDPLARNALAAYLATAPDITHVGYVADGSEVAAAVDRLNPDVVLMDLRMPHVDGVAATGMLRVSHPRVRVLVVTALGDLRLVSLLVEAGAAGFLHKTARPADFVSAIRLTATGHRVLPGAHAPSSDSAPRKYTAPADLHLTRRETEVLAALAQGGSNREIGSTLGIAESTVKLHLTSIMTKTGTASRTQLLGASP
jgi:DNA-binding NarL/FixJ family response regulator